MKTIIMLLFCILTSNYVYSTDYVYLGGWSYHLEETVQDGDRYVKPNSSHNLIGIRYKSYNFSTFENSYYNRSYSAGLSLLMYDYRFLEISLNSLVYTGYDNCGFYKLSNKNCFVILPEFTFKNKQLPVQFSILMVPDFMALSFRFKLQ